MNTSAQPTLCTVQEKDRHVLDQQLHAVELEGRGESNGQPCVIENVCSTRLDHRGRSDSRSPWRDSLSVCLYVRVCVCMFVLSVLSVYVPVPILSDSL